MARRRRSPGQMALLEGIEAWYCPAATVRIKLRKIGQYAQFVDHASDVTAARLIALEAGESLQMMERFVDHWQAFWALVYHAPAMSADDTVTALKKLREEMQVWGN